MFTAQYLTLAVTVGGNAILESSRAPVSGYAVTRWDVVIKTTGMDLAGIPEYSSQGCTPCARLDFVFDEAGQRTVTP